LEILKMIEQIEDTNRVSGQDLAVIIRTLREIRGWSQDTLAELTGLSVRTVQRVECGEPSNTDTRQALARAFELDDIDAFNKPLHLPDPKYIQAEMERFEREHLTLETQIATSGRDLVRVFDTADMSSASSVVELEDDAAEAFAGLVDYLREYRDCADLMSETDKLGAGGNVQQYFDRLVCAGYSVVYARRKTALVGKNWPDKTPLKMTIAYLVVYPKGKEPAVIAVERQIEL
jgi:transcriptional regulator with XRE-family HTH domain